MKLYMFRTVPLSIIRSFLLYAQQWYMSYRFADSLRAGSGWNCSASSWFYYKKFNMMHGHMNIKFVNAGQAKEIYQYKNTKEKL
jgi:hypothetical protein